MTLHRFENRRFRFEGARAGWTVYAALILTGFMIGGSVVTGIFKHVYATPLMPDDPESSIFGPIPSPAGAVPAADPVADAKRVKPLADSKKDDRVIYRGKVCQWQAWHVGISTAVIKCPGHPDFATQTGQLTPVELRTSR